VTTDLLLAAFACFVAAALAPMYLAKRRAYRGDQAEIADAILGALVAQDALEVGDVYDAVTSRSGNVERPAFHFVFARLVQSGAILVVGEHESDVTGRKRPLYSLSASGRDDRTAAARRATT